MSDERDSSGLALDGVRIIDFSEYAAGPWCTSLLGDVGADIIKVERPGRGDGSRAFDRLFGERNSSYYAGMNRNKRNIALNLSTPEGRDIARRLIAGADVLVENFRVGVMQRLGMAYEQLCDDNPRLIYCSITAYGEDGPYIGKPGMDGVLQAMGGVMGHTGEPGLGPVRIGVAIADFTAAFLCMYGIATALFERERSGRGQKVSVALLDGQVALFANHVPGFVVTGKPDQPIGTAHPLIEPSRIYRTADGYMVVSALTQQFWERFARSLELPELIDDPRFMTNGERVRNRDELTRLVHERLTTRPTREWIEILESADVPCTPVNMLKDLFHDPQVLRNGMIQSLPHPTAGEIKVVGSPVKFDRTPPRLRRGPAKLGQHTREVLEEMGYDPTRVSTLADQGVVALEDD